MDKIRAFYSMIIVGVSGGLILSAPQNLSAQSYPGLAAPAPVQNNDMNNRAAPAAPPTGGYGGLTQSAPMRAPVRPQAPAEGADNTAAAAQESAPNAAVQTAQPLPPPPAGEVEVEQSFAPGNFGDMAIRSPEQLNVAALVAESAKASPIDLKGRTLPARTLAALNQTQEKKGGLWPKEAQAIRYVNTLYNDIKTAPAAERRQKIDAAKQQIKSMIDANQAKLAAPDSVSLQLGMNQQTITNAKAAAEAANVHLQKALRQLN